MPVRRLAFAVALMATACDQADAPPPATDAPPPAADDAAVAANPQDAFWAALADLCGQAFEGTVRESNPPDTAFAGRTLAMHVRECAEDEIRIPFHVGEDRSRTWVLTRTGQGIRLKHDHRHADGTPDEVTMYGGDTAESGTASSQSFPADDETAALIPAATTNVWTLEVEPGARFVYALRREGSDRRFRAEFDLSRSVPPPPAPWGSSQDR